MWYVPRQTSGAHAVRLKVLIECLRQRSMSAGPTVVPCMPGVFMTDLAGFPYREAENCCESVQGTSTVRKQNKYAAFFLKKK